MTVRQKMQKVVAVAVAAMLATAVMLAVAVMVVAMMAKEAVAAAVTC